MAFAESAADHSVVFLEFLMTMKIRFSVSGVQCASCTWLILRNEEKPKNKCNLNCRMFWQLFSRSVTGLIWTSHVTFFCRIFCLFRLDASSCLSLRIECSRYSTYTKANPEYLSLNLGRPGGCSRLNWSHTALTSTYVYTYRKFINHTFYDVTRFVGSSSSFIVSLLS